MRIKYGDLLALKQATQEVLSYQPQRPWLNDARSVKRNRCFQKYPVNGGFEERLLILYTLLSKILS